MFEYDEDAKKVDFSHNPFSMPQGELEALETKDPLDILAYQYDIVCNGVELSSGAIRNHRPDIMYKAFEIAGYTPGGRRHQFRRHDQRVQISARRRTAARRRASTASSCCSPTSRTSARSSLFPMNQKAEDLMMSAPSEVTPEAAARAEHPRVEAGTAKLMPPRLMAVVGAGTQHSGFDRPRAASLRASRQSGRRMGMTITSPTMKRRQYRRRLCRRSRRLQKRLAHIQVAHIVHKRRALIVFEGWDAAGRAASIQRLTADWDPRHFEVWPIKAPTDEEKARHFLWRFWSRLPGTGDIAIFDRSWYGRVLVERVEGYRHAKRNGAAAMTRSTSSRRSRRDYGTTIVKLFIHVTQEEQDKRLQGAARASLEALEDRRRRLSVTAPSAPTISTAMDEMFRTHRYPLGAWIAIDGNDKKSARIAALTAIADRLEADVEMTPPDMDPGLEALARTELGL